ncbi:flippase-like domain-containing protein [Candidatus Daviesbacteria bacterium]|nr:flippase-like domain-containing protein [Candidatus Daviesbacteria bacterium]
MAKTLVRVLLNTAIGVVLIYFWLKLVNLEEIKQTLVSFNPLILIPAILSLALASILKALRFKVLLSETADISFLRMVYLTFVSQLLSFTIPVRAGEVAKGVYLSTQYNLHFGKAVVWVFLDRFLDFWAALGLSLVLLLIIPTNLPQSLTIILLAGVIVASLITVLIVFRPAYFHRLSKFLSHLLIINLLKVKFLKLSFFIVDCFALLGGNFSRSFRLAILTVVASLFEGLCWYLIFAFYIPDVSVFKVWLGSMLTALTFLIPAAPGYVGSAEAAGLAVFSFGLGLSQSIVPAVTIIFHAVGLVFILSSGILGLFMLKFNLKLVWKRLLNRS